MLQLYTILHPTDLSERSEYAFRLACSLAQELTERRSRCMPCHRRELPGSTCGPIVSTGCSGTIFVFF